MQPCCGFLINLPESKIIQVPNRFKVLFKSKFLGFVEAPVGVFYLFFSIISHNSNTAVTQFPVYSAFLFCLPSNCGYNFHRSK